MVISVSEWRRKQDPDLSNPNNPCQCHLYVPILFTGVRTGQAAGKSDNFHKSLSYLQWFLLLWSSLLVCEVPWWTGELPVGRRAPSSSVHSDEGEENSKGIKNAELERWESPLNTQLKTLSAPVPWPRTRGGLPHVGTRHLMLMFAPEGFHHVFCSGMIVSGN